MTFNRKFYFSLIATLCMSMGFTSCSDDDNPDEPTIDEELSDYHIDLWVALDRHGGMGRDVQTLVRSISPEMFANPDEVISFEGTGTEVNSLLTLETIVKGPYYYQVPVSGDRFSKYTIEDNRINVVAEQQFKTNTFNARKYDYAWVTDNTLLIVAASGDAKSIIWTKLNADNMTIISEGTLDISLPEGAEIFNTSGILTYRKQDNRLFYFYIAKTKGGMKGKRVGPFHIAVINPDNMSVVSDVVNDRADEMPGTAYGQLLQQSTFVDDKGNLYMACMSETDDKETSHLLRINAGQYNFDPSYEGFTNSGKLLAVEYLGENKCLAYARDDEFGTGIDSYSHYYSVIDLASPANNKRLEADGQTIGYSGGRFSSRMGFANGVAYVGVNTENADPCVYLYDVKTGKTSKGATIKEGYFFEQIRILENLKN